MDVFIGLRNALIISFFLYVTIYLIVIGIN